MPNQEVMREWVSRLRSGEYTQGNGKLSHQDRTGRKHCCLGVLADMAVEKGLTDKPVTIPDRVRSYLTPSGQVGTEMVDVFTYEGANTTMPPRGVLEWADVPLGNAAMATLSEELSANRLAYLNDTGKSFDQIADLIEEQWTDLPEGTQIPDSPADIAEKEDANA